MTDDNETHQPAHATAATSCGCAMDASVCECAECRCGGCGCKAD